MEGNKNILLEVVAPYAILGVLAYVIIRHLENKASKGVDSVLSGDVFKSKSQIETDKAVLDATKGLNWLDKEKALPVSQRSLIKKSTALNIANQFHEVFREPIGGLTTMSTANKAYELFKKIASLGSLYYVFSTFGIRDGMDFNSYAFKVIGNDNSFSKDLVDVNRLFKSKKINYAF